jgi:hypothetical protein
MEHFTRGLRLDIGCLCFGCTEQEKNAGSDYKAGPEQSLQREVGSFHRWEIGQDRATLLEKT